MDGKKHLTSDNGEKAATLERNQSDHSFLLVSTKQVDGTMKKKQKTKNKKQTLNGEINEIAPTDPTRPDPRRGVRNRTVETNRPVADDL